MAKREPTSTFIAELPLVVQPQDDRTMVSRLEAGRRLYNVVLQESLKRLGLMRQSKGWQAARALPKGAERTATFKIAQQKYGFSEYSLHEFAAKAKNAANFKSRLGAFETQKLATRAFKAVETYSFGTRGKPRFKAAHKPLRSIEGKSNDTGIRWQAGTGCVEWKGLVLPALLPTAQQDPYLAQALKAKTKYCRLVWRMEKGRRRWFVQLSQEGEAPAKYEFLSSGQVVGLDIGPSTIAIVTEDAVALETFAPGVVQPWAQVCTLQRAQDRSRRATNPDSFNPDGTCKPGKGKRWTRSKRYLARQAELAELERKLAETRTKEHGTLANNILGLGNLIQTEKLSYKSFQRCYGRSVKVRAPGAFISLLTRKAESAGGRLDELNTRQLRMSQYDHVSGECTKKPLSLRWHALSGSDKMVQRDCYSAFLAQQVPAGQHNPPRLKESWAAAVPLLLRAGLCINQLVSGRLPACPPVAIPAERVARNRVQAPGLNRDVVAARRELDSPGRACT